MTTTETLISQKPKHLKSITKNETSIPPPPQPESRLVRWTLLDAGCDAVLVGEDAHPLVFRDCVFVILVRASRAARYHSVASMYRDGLEAAGGAFLTSCLQ